MGKSADKTLKNIDKILQHTQEGKQGKRFIEYKIRGLSVTNSFQITRDFTVTTENRLVEYANKVNANEFKYDFISSAERWLLDIPIVGTILKRMIGTQNAICEAYNYLGDTIKKIFQQARSADVLYSGKITNNSVTVAETSVLLLSKLNDAFEYYEINKDYGCDIAFALAEIYENDVETIEVMNAIRGTDDETKIEAFVQDESNIEVFNTHSQIIYDMYFSDDSSEHHFVAKIIKDNEETIDKIVSLLIDKFYSYVDKSNVEAYEFLIGDGDVANLVYGFLQSTGLTGIAKGVIKIAILKKLKDEVHANYKKLFKKIHSGKSKDYDRLKKLYNLLKKLEIEIIDSYKEANQNEPDNQIEANEWIDEVEACEFAK